MCILSRIIEDNIMYLNEWSLHNNLIDSALKIEGNYLIYENIGNKEKIIYQIISIYVIILIIKSFEK